MNKPSLPLLALSLALPLLPACGADLPQLNPIGHGEFELTELLGLDDPEVVAVTVEPETGRTFLLDAEAGLFELHADGEATLYRSMDEFPLFLDSFLPVFTDLAALGDNRFAIVAQNNGFLLDLTEDTLTQYFCYVPEDMDPIDSQLTESVVFDASQDLLFAQPRTLSSTSDESLGASIGAYAMSGGQPVAWFELDDDDFLAGGATALADGSLLFGRDNELHRFSLEREGEISPVGTLPGVGRIEGMALRPSDGHLLVVDGERDLLLDLKLSLTNN